MPQPTSSSVHIDKAISNAAMMYSNAMFVAEEFAPRLSVSLDSDDYFIFDKGAWFRVTAVEDRKAGTRAPRNGYTLSSSKYSLNYIAQAHPIPDRVVENADDVIRPYENGTNYVMQMVMLQREIMTASAFFGTSKWGTDSTKSGTDQWSDYSNSDPANDVQTAITTIQKNTGIKPNVALMGQEVMDKLVLHPDGLDRFKHTQTGVMTLEMVQQWLNIPKIIVGGAVKNTAEEGQTDSMAYIWGKNCLIAYVTDGPSIDQASAAYIFQKDGVKTKRYYEDAEAQDVVEAEIATDPVITGSDLGYYIAAAVA